MKRGLFPPQWKYVRLELVFLTMAFIEQIGNFMFELMLPNLVLGLIVLTALLVKTVRAQRATI